MQSGAAAWLLPARDLGGLTKRKIKDNIGWSWVRGSQCARNCDAGSSEGVKTNPEPVLSTRLENIFPT